MGVQTEIKVINKMTPRLRRAVVFWRRAIQEELTNALDEIRRRAQSKYIVKNAFLPERRPWVLTKKQPSIMGKLTERTGALNKMLEFGIGNWDKSGTKMWKSNSPAIKGTVKVVGAVGRNEAFVAQLNINSIDRSTLLSAIGGDLPNNLKRYLTAQRLIMRFRWDKNGIRGETRPFLAPAAKDQIIKTQAIVQAKIKELEQIK